MGQLRASYLSPIMTADGLKKTSKQIIERIEKQNINFDSFAFRGFSGSIIAPVVAMQMNKRMLAVRKNDGNHSAYKVEGEFDGERYIIIDDVIASGNTMRTIKYEIEDAYHEIGNDSPYCVGMVLYNNGSLGIGTTEAMYKEFPSLRFIEAFYA